MSPKLVVHNNTFCTNISNSPYDINSKFNGAYYSYSLHCNCKYDISDYLLMLAPSTPNTTTKQWTIKGQNSVQTDRKKSCICPPVRLKFKHPDTCERKLVRFFEFKTDGQRNSCLILILEISETKFNVIYVSPF